MPEQKIKGGRGPWAFHQVEYIKTHARSPAARTAGIRNVFLSHDKEKVNAVPSVFILTDEEKGFATDWARREMLAGRGRTDPSFASFVAEILRRCHVTVALIDEIVPMGMRYQKPPAQVPIPKPVFRKSERDGFAALVSRLTLESVVPARIKLFSDYLAKIGSTEADWIQAVIGILHFCINQMTQELVEYFMEACPFPTARRRFVEGVLEKLSRNGVESSPKRQRLQNIAKWAQSKQ